MTQVPLAPPPPEYDQRWLWLLYKRIKDLASAAWTAIDFTGSNITSIATRNHNDLQSKQGGSGTEFYHLTAAQNTVVGNTSGTNTGDNVEVAAQAIGFTITKGTTPKTLTVPLDASVSGTNTGDQALGSYAPLASPTFTGTVTYDLAKGNADFIKQSIATGVTLTVPAGYGFGVVGPYVVTGDLVILGDMVIM
jgi:hypothetical protein